jgi:hypothetical protein
VTYESVLDELYRELPEFHDEFVATDDVDDPRDEYEVIGWLPSWYVGLADEGRAEVLARAVAFLERAARDAARDEELENVLLLQLGEGFPFTDAAWDALGPAARELITRGNDGKRPPHPHPIDPAELEAEIQRLRDRRR